MTVTPNLTLSEPVAAETLPLSTDLLLRVRRLEAEVQALQVTVRHLAELLDRRAERDAAALVRTILTAPRP